MSSIFIAKGSMADTLGFLKGDLLDTYQHQSDVLDKLLDVDNNSSAQDFTGKFCLNDRQYWMDFDSTNRVINVYNSSSVQSANPDSIINVDNEDLSTGLWSSIDALEADVQDAMDSTMIMYSAACSAENNDSSGIISKISASVSSWIVNAGVKAKECFQSLADAVINAGDNAAAVIAWIVGQYQSIGDATADTNGEYHFTDDRYHVQGFVGQYAIGVIFQAATTVLGLVAAVIAPIIGFTISLAGSAVSSLIGLIPDSSDTYVVENAKALNNIYAQPLFQGEYDLADVPIELYATANNSPSKSVTIRYPGVTVYESVYDNKFYVEIFASLDYANYSNPYIYGNAASVGRTRYKEDYPYNTRLQDLQVSHSWRRYLPDKDVLLADLASFDSALKPATSISDFADDINAEKYDYTDLVSPDRAWKYFDRACRSSLALTYTWITQGAANVHYDNDTSIEWSPSGSWTAPDWNNYTYANACHFAETVFATSWEDLCNIYIPQHRTMYRNHQFILDYLTFMGSYEAEYDNWLIIQGLPNNVIPKYTPPKYSDTARSTTIGIAILIGVAVIGTLVAKSTIRISQRKKQIGRYREVQSNWNRYLETGSDADLKAYRKSIKKYNRWAWIAGTSKLSGISGWELGDSSTGDIALPSANKTDSVRYQSNNNNANGESVAFLQIIKNAITG